MPFPLLSVIETVLVASITGFGSITRTVTSSVVFPSLSIPSSEVSETSPPVVLAVTVTLFITPPASITA